ncbi:MAG: cupin domain-containing protein [Armatimonadetes bacterium]|nr:cupin domain-containing protein [Armatimonadota bacterium]
MPIIQGPGANAPSDEFTAWGLVRFQAGQKNITELHHHDCDEFVFMVEGRCLMRSEGILYTLEKGDVLVTRMGDEHELLEILEDTVYFWACTRLRGRKRPGHLHRDRKEAP